MHEFTHVSTMMRDDETTLLAFVAEMVAKKEEFLTFTNSFRDVDEQYKGVRIEFYELDADNYGYDVAKWSVKFEADVQDKLVFRGYYVETFYKLINQKTGNIELKARGEDIYDYVNSEKFAQVTQEEVDELFATEDYQFDKCKTWLEGKFSIPMVFDPCPTYT